MMRGYETCRNYHTSKLSISRCRSGNSQTHFTVIQVGNMKTIHRSIQALSNFLKDLPANERMITENSRPKVLELLQECWPHLSGSDEHNTRSDKIYRAENLRWMPPILYFELERHGATVNGSSRADVHHWEIDVDDGTAQVVKEGRRQLTKMAPRMDVRAKAKEIADAILNGREHPSFNWDNNQEWVVITISEIIPNQQHCVDTNPRRAD